MPLLLHLCQYHFLKPETYNIESKMFPLYLVILHFIVPFGHIHWEAGQGLLQLLGDDLYSLGCLHFLVMFPVGLQKTHLTVNFKKCVLVLNSGNLHTKSEVCSAVFFRYWYGNTRSTNQQTEWPTETIQYFFQKVA